MDPKRRARKAMASLLLAAAGPASAGSGGGAPLDFLFLDASARAAGMGGAYAALAGGADALSYNPGGAGRVRRHEAAFTHHQGFEGVTQEHLGYAGPNGFAASISYLGSGDARRTTVSNPTGAGLGTVGASDVALAVGWGPTRSGRRWTLEGLDYGAGLRFIRESLAGYSAETVAVDAGGLWSVGRLPGLDLGLVLQNLGPAVEFESSREGLPWSLKGGAAYSFKARGRSCAVSLDVSKAAGDRATVAVGAEVVAAGRLPVRLGYNGRNDAGVGLTAGFGWTQDGFQADYAFSPYGDIGWSHRISVTVRWGPR